MQTIFWQWVNQSYNLGVNYANRNASNKLSTKQLLTAYGSAVVASCSVALGLSECVKRGIFPRFVARFVPFTAVSSAGALNVFVMRWNEVSNGVQVYDENDKRLGVSKKAGLLGVSLTALSRVVWNFPALGIPPVVLSLVTKKGWVTSSYGKIAVQLGAIGLSLHFGVPFAIAMFKPDLEVPVEKLEEEFQNMKDENGEPIKSVFFHKGL